MTFMVSAQGNGHRSTRDVLMTIMGVASIFAASGLMRHVSVLAAVRPFLVAAASVVVISRRRWIVCGAVAPVLAAFPPIGVGWLIGPFAYAPLFYFIEADPHPRSSAALAAWMGAVPAYVLTDWATQTLPYPELIAILLSGLIAVLWVPAGVVLGALLRQRRLGWLVLSVMVIPIIDMVRCDLSGLRLAYNTAPHMVMENLALAQFVEPLGTFGFSMLLSSISLSSAKVVRSRHVLSSAALGLAIGGILLLGDWRRRAVDKLPTQPLEVIVVQDFDQAAWGHGPAQGVERPDPKRLARRAAEALADGPCEAMFLPETALARSEPASPGQTIIDDSWTPDELACLLGCNDPPVPVAVAGLTVIRDRLNQPPVYRNTCSLVTPEAGLIAVRDKLVRAPVGERVPLASVPLLGYLLRRFASEPPDYTSEDTRATLELPGGQIIAVAICYEHVFPHIWREKGATDMSAVDLLVGLANLRWIGYSQVEREQSRAARRLAAILHRRPYLYVASGGSELLSPSGQLCAALGPYESSRRIKVQLPVHEQGEGRQWYCRIRDVVDRYVWIFSAVIVLLYAWTQLISKIHHEHTPGSSHGL